MQKNKPLIEKVMQSIDKIGYNSNICIYILLIICGLFIMFILYLIK